MAKEIPINCARNDALSALRAGQRGSHRTPRILDPFLRGRGAGGLPPTLPVGSQDGFGPPGWMASFVRRMTFELTEN